MIKETSFGDDVVYPLQFDEFIQAIHSPTKQEVNTIIYFPFQYFDDDLFFDLESE
jgi:hypothetical protein